MTIGEEIDSFLGHIRVALFTPRPKHPTGYWSTLAREHAARPAEHRAERHSVPTLNEEIPMHPDETTTTPGAAAESVRRIHEVTDMEPADRRTHYRTATLSDLHAIAREAAVARDYAAKIREAAAIIEQEVGQELRQLADQVDSQASEGKTEARKMPTSWESAEALRSDIATWPELDPECGLVLDGDGDLLTPERLERGTYLPYRMLPAAKSVLERLGLA